MSEREETVEIEVHVHRATLGDKGALLVSEDGEAAHAVWIPKSQVIDEDRDSAGKASRGDVLSGYRAVLTVPAWLAEEKGLSGSARDTDTGDLFS